MAAALSICFIAKIGAQLRGRRAARRLWDPACFQNVFPRFLIDINHLALQEQLCLF